MSEAKKGISRRRLLSMGGVLALAGAGAGALYRYFSSTSAISVQSFATRGMGRRYKGAWAPRFKPASH